MFQSLKNWLGLAFYTSKLDQFLNQFRERHPTLSASQRKEKEKYAKIFALRDRESAKMVQKPFWDKF